MATNRLVTYFSASGTTARVARDLASVAGADLFEIVPQEPYTAADLDWRNRSSRSTSEMKDRASRPAVASRVGDMGQYDTIYLGFPIWWGEAPRVVETFLEACDLAGKTVVPFATSGGSGIGGAHRALAAAAPGARVEAGALLNGYPGKDRLAKFAAQA